MIGCEINVGADRGNTVVRDAFDPVTFPELLVLGAIHGGEDHVKKLVSFGYEERDAASERERLNLKYGSDIVSSLFPGAVQALPTENISIPTDEEISAGDIAAKTARASVRTKAPVKNVLPPQPVKVADSVVVEAPDMPVRLKKNAIPDLVS